MSTMTMTNTDTTPATATGATVGRGLHIRERGRLLRGAEAASLSSRERAGALAGRALAGAPPTARSLVLELDGVHGHCVLAVGDAPAAVWRFDARTLRVLAEAFASEVPRLDALGSLRAEASRLVLGMRLHALRGSVGDVVVVHDHPDVVSRLVGSMLLEAIVEHVWTEEVEVSVTPASWREGAEYHTA
jgi:hypothetical protein